MCPDQQGLHRLEISGSTLYRLDQHAPAIGGIGDALYQPQLLEPIERTRDGRFGNTKVSRKAADRAWGTILEQHQEYAELNRSGFAGGSNS